MMNLVTNKYYVAITRAGTSLIVLYENDGGTFLEKFSKNGDNNKATYKKEDDNKIIETEHSREVSWEDLDLPL